MTIPATNDRSQLIVWWVFWGAILAALTIVYLLFGRGPLVLNAPPEKSLTGIAGLVPLFVSIIIRWLILPRYTDIRRAFVMFVVGVALAETCGFLGIFLGGPYRDFMFVLGILGIAQFMPFFARQYLEPKPQGFFPNN